MTKLVQHDGTRKSGSANPNTDERHPQSIESCVRLEELFEVDEFDDSFYGHSNNQEFEQDIAYEGLQAMSQRWM